MDKSNDRSAWVAKQNCGQLQHFIRAVVFNAFADCSCHSCCAKDCFADDVGANLIILVSFSY